MRHAGALGGENVGMSNHKRGETPRRRKPKVSSAMSITGGLGDAKDNRTLGYGRPMLSRLIFRPFHVNRWSDGEYKLERIIGFPFFGSRIVVWKIRRLTLMSKFEFEETSGNRGIPVKRLPRKTSKIINMGNVLKTETGGQV